MVPVFLVFCLTIPVPELERPRSHLIVHRFFFKIKLDAHKNNKGLFRITHVISGFHDFFFSI